MVKLEQKMLERNISAERDQKQILKNGQIVFQNVSIYWEINNSPFLHHIDLTIKKGQMLGITGKTGSGKSTLLMAILQQIPYYSGSIYKKGTISYVEHEPNLFSATIKQNITFGFKFEEKKYEKCLQLACLKEDLALLQNKDQTNVGQGGSSLSGGQKARVLLARAFYSQADILLLDDPFSAIDRKVAAKIFRSLIQMKGQKTIVLVTHQISFLLDCSSVIIMQKGRISQKGSSQTIKHWEDQESCLVSQNEPIVDLYQKQQNNSIKKAINKQNNSEAAQILNQKKIEQRKQQIGIKTYLKYIFWTKTNYLIFPISMLVFILSDLANIYYVRMMINCIQTNLGSYWVLLGLLQFSSMLFTLLKYILIFRMTLMANNSIHSGMVQGILRSFCSYFDIISQGQLMNKFSNDIGILDTSIAIVFIDVFEGFFACTILLLNVLQINKLLLIPGLFSVFFIIFIFNYSKKVLIESKNLELKLKDPLFHKIHEMISNLIQIKIYMRRQTLLKQFSHTINNSLKGYICYKSISRVFGVLLNYSSVILVWIGLNFGLINLNKQNLHLYGLSIVFLIQITNSLQWFMRQIIVLNTQMISAERIFRVVDLPQESFQQNTQNFSLNQTQTAQEDQQTENCIQMQNLSPSGYLKLDKFTFKYRPQLPNTLLNLSLQVSQFEKIAIIGRTGAGKSSIVHALLRLTQPQQGSIYKIGEDDALTLKTNTLRKKMTVIPQNPFFFRGTIRQNLDPFCRNTDSEIWSILKELSLQKKLKKLKLNLTSDISALEDGLSIGGRQLLCFARAFLNSANIIILDQPTSYLDNETEKIIQKCIRQNWKQKTIITIAHRIHTIIDYDKLIVMKEGRITFIGKPSQLIKTIQLSPRGFQA